MKLANAQSKKMAYLNLHVAVFLFGFTAILGDLITLDAVPLVWWRLLIACTGLYLFFGVRSELGMLDRTLLPRLAFIGIIIGIHWVTFFASIKIANASITLICLSTASFFTAILEPIILKIKHNPIDILLGLLIIPGFYFIVRNSETAYIWGIVLGLTSSFLGALFVILNKQIVDRANPFTITFVELLMSFLVLSVCLTSILYFDSSLRWIPQGLDWPYLLVLGLICTCIGFTIALNSLKYLSAFLSNLTVNLEPIYGILMALLILGESKELDRDFYIGCTIIVLSVFALPLIELFQKKTKPISI